MSRWHWVLKQFTRKLWVRATLIGALGVLAAILAAVVERYVPWEYPGFIGADAVEGLLTIIASSMLAVTTFSMSVVISAYGSAANSVTPRATKLLQEDNTTQNVLSAFIGSFLFSIVGIVVLKTGAYGERGRVILFIITVAVIVLIVFSLLRWIDHLTRFGRVGETTDRVEAAARAALEARLRAPYLGGSELSDPDHQIPDHAAEIMADHIGYVQNIDMATLARCAEEVGGDVFILLNPGAFVYKDTALVRLVMPEDADHAERLEHAIREAFTISGERDFDQDPRFGLAVLSEVGARALSAATNDPGTAIDVIGRAVRLMSLWSEESQSRDAYEPRFPTVYIPALKDADLFEDAFMIMARDAGALIEVHLRLQKALLALSRQGSAEFRQAAREQADLALIRAEAALTIPQDRKRLQEVREGGPN